LADGPGRRLMLRITALLRTELSSSVTFPYHAMYLGDVDFV
jgi:hypothetical protein